MGLHTKLLEADAFASVASAILMGMKLAARIISFSMGAAFALSPLLAFASPLSISSCNDLEKIASSSYPSYTASSSYVLTQNIDCSATATQHSNGSGGYYGFTPIPDFTGTFNGAGYTISNLYISTTTTNVGLFSILDATSTVENLTLAGGSVSGGTNVGALAGEMLSTAAIQNVTSSMSVTDTGGYLGGLVGYGNSANATIASSSVSGSVSSSQNSAYYIGGLVGDMLGTISNSFATGSVSATGTQYNEYIGGLAGYNAGTVSNSYATGNILALGYESYYVGGLIGDTNAAVTNSYATGSVTVNGDYSEDIGGLIGIIDGGTVASSSASGAVTATGANDEYLGGFVGYSENPINNSYAIGSVTGTTTTEYVGGFVGYQEAGAITECYETGNVINGGPDSVGGFVGAADDVISKSFATGNVSLSGTYVDYAGGFAGYNEYDIDNSYSTGNVSVPASAGADVYYVGGFDGYGGSSITNSYSTGNILGTSAYHDIGGFVGYNAYPILNSYSTGGGAALLLSTTTGSSAYFIGENISAALTNDAEFVQGTPAIGDNHPTSGSVALLATHGYGTDESTLSNFYSTTEPVYAQATTTAWNFSSIWETHPNALPTFQWYSGVTPTYTITATAGTGGQINNAGAFSVLSGANQSYTIIPSSGYSIASVLVDGTSVGAVSSYTFSNVAANHTISVTFTSTTPIVSYGGGGSSGGGTVSNQVTNLISNGNTTAATALIQQYPSLFPNGISAISAGTSTTVSASGTITFSSFTRALTLGSIGTDVKALQEYLNTHGCIIATTGAGSPGNETTYFGKATRTALAKFQKAHSITPAVGYFGSITRAYIEAHP